ncbi:hypothetical protein ACG3SL_04725 [Sphingomonas sp. CJ20]
MTTMPPAQAPAPTALETARQIAADMLAQTGRADDARIVAHGGGDDFIEVRIALAAAGRTASRSALIERALRCYADPTFWDGEPFEAALAYHDQGVIARAGLLGREMFGQHRD